jgi:hypothetical protein
MKSFLLFLLIAFFQSPLQAQQIFLSKNASISFFSSTPAEDIEGKSTTANSALDIKSGNLLFKVSNTSFQFKKKLMQEHFNENYMESEKYPVSTFKGKINEAIDLSKDGSYLVTVNGTLDIHGVSKPYVTKVTLVVDKGIITAKTVFKVKIADHKIEIPSLVFTKIAESVEVRLSAVYQPK